MAQKPSKNDKMAISGFDFLALPPRFFNILQNGFLYDDQP